LLINNFHETLQILLLGCRRVVRRVNGGDGSF
jgi:hypothetical protein